jgi:outer membrane protein OmpA-like peptidoglycan-associated protein
MKKIALSLLTLSIIISPSFSQIDQINISDLEKKLDKLKEMHALECSPVEVGKVESYLESLKQEVEKDKNKGQKESTYTLYPKKKSDIDYVIIINNLLSQIEKNIYSDKDKDGIPCYKEVELGLNPNIPDKREEKVIVKEENKPSQQKQEENPLNQPVRVHFYFNSADIKKEYLPYLNIVVKYMKTHQNVKIKIVGYTDNIGSKSYNQKLALKRAQAVKNYLVKLGVNPSRIVIEGVGKSDYIVSNSKELDRFTNRRAEFYTIKLSE